MTAMIITVVAMIGVGLIASKWNHIKNFGVLRRAVLYRSAQPSAHQVAVLSGRYGIKTIVNLRPTSEDADQGWYESERQAAQRFGIRMVDLPVRAGCIPTDQDVTRFLALCRDSENHPILLHCEAGQARTGYLAAIWRMEFDGMDVEDAIGEMQQYRFRPGRYAKHLDRLRAYARHLERR
ncbi:MAG TPA: dual specificity protein phosphatase family protein [Phycisphaerae bacterium]|nr:dual specificity protein phosphatase family protein [Phycisphaerae bacterium]